MEEKLAESLERERDLKSQVEHLESEKECIENEYKSHSETTAEKISDLESKLRDSVALVEDLQLQLDSTQQEVGVAKEDARKYSEEAVGTQELYERELLQHGKSMESLHRVKEEVREGLTVDRVENGSSFLSLSLSPSLPLLLSLPPSLSPCLLLPLSFLISLCPSPSLTLSLHHSLSPSLSLSLISITPSPQVTRLQEALTESKSESSLLRDKLTSSQTTLQQRTTAQSEERETLTKRADDLSQQNALLHDEAEKLSAKIVTLQERGREALPPLPVETVTTETSTDQLWEIIRYTQTCIHIYKALATVLLIHVHVHVRACMYIVHCKCLFSIYNVHCTMMSSLHHQVCEEGEGDSGDQARACGVGESTSQPEGGASGATPKRGRASVERE